MTQLPMGNALSAFRNDARIVEIEAEVLDRWRIEHFAGLAQARDKLHRDVVSTADAKRKAERDRRNGKRNVRRVQLDVGDYVLIGKVSQAFGPKLQVTWLGPRRIIQALSDWVFIVEDLRDGAVSEHHVSRLKLYAVRDSNVTQDLLDHVAYVEGGHLVQELRDAKFDRSDKTWKIQVKWRGLSELENSWEPVSNLLEAVPTMVAAFVKKHARWQCEDDG
ncbi:hypothetical protein H310_02778 [Aphanomyces invadans]|uniref:Chromo domain-containing protein n=1 Tax=Aphanomyces invadans TaxID=157072 RepID=A0A024UJE1_9STRA|nr:hypothetical protein H310_02778 [Aphanomyces invadans]ETW06561.1 hypothetical protein H310_02778 [Aphanomyces invadans]|eukprot:XP_008864636.1 hypothetical protein H310_02778 [Aphanomyces invadans]